MSTMVTDIHVLFMELAQDEWPQIKYPTDGGQREGYCEINMSITVETYIGKVGGKEGVKLEQQYLVGENNLELMSHHPLEHI